MKLVYGVGINDANYQVEKKIKVFEQGQVKYKTLWICPFFLKWKNMLNRCYNHSYQKTYPSYSGCEVIESWKTFSNFKTWMETQDWEHKVLDKDILFPGNKIYGPDNCVFVTEAVNNFVTDRKAQRGDHPIGVSFHKRLQKYQSRCNDLNGKNVHLGYFITPEEAHQAWLSFKLSLAKVICYSLDNEAIKTALISRYS